MTRYIFPFLYKPLIIEFASSAPNKLKRCIN